MPNIYLKLLEDFEATGLSSKKSISPFMEKHFKKPTSSNIDTWNKSNESARLFIKDVRNTNHFDFDPFEDYDIGYNQVTKEYRWYDVVNINARITISGLEYLEKHQVNKSTSRTNIATIINFIVTIGFAATAVYFTRANLTLSKENNSQTTLIQQRLDSTKMQVSKLETQYTLLQKQLLNNNLAKKTSNRIIRSF